MNKTQAEPIVWFFDDADPKVGFEFVKPTSKHQKQLNIPPILTSPLKIKDTNTNTTKQGFYALHGSLLVFYESEFSTSCEAVLDISNARLKPFEPNQTEVTHGFNMVKNNGLFEVNFADKQMHDNWVSALRNFCIFTNFHEEYRASKMIGKGSFAKVYLVDAKTDGKQYAVKAFAKGSIGSTDKNNPRATMINEISIMRDLEHENIIKLHEVFETERSIYLVMELIQGKPLQTPLSKMTFKKDYSEKQIVEMIHSILDALAYMASKGIMHRDLKPDNMLIDKAGKIKIIDFGLATYIDVPEYIFKKCGTPGYIAPEVFRYNQKMPSTNYDDRCDVFSAGCILFYMLFGYPFFDGSDASEILQLNREFSEFEALYFLKKEVKNPTSKVSKEGLDILIQLLEYDQKKRLRASQALSHPYFHSSSRVIQRAASLKDSLTECTSPTSFNKNTGYIDSMKSESGSPLVPSGNRFAEKDSLYLDVGKPEMNGRIDTLATGSSANNSLLIKNNSNNTSNVNSVSAFAKQKDNGEQEPKSPNKVFKGHGPAGNNFLKQAILLNAQKNNNQDISAEPVEVKKPEFVRPHHERRHTDYTLPAHNELMLTKKNSNPGTSTSSGDIDDMIGEDCQIKSKVEKMNERTSKKHPSKLINSNSKPQYYVQ